MTPSIFSIDVEDWYHILDVDSAPTTIAEWDALPARVEANFRRLLDILGETYVNLRTPERKIRNILSDFPVTTFNDYMTENRARLEVS